jgi:hypothetical protein
MIPLIDTAKGSKHAQRMQRVCSNYARSAQASCRSLCRLNDHHLRVAAHASSNHWKLNKRMEPE